MIRHSVKVIPVWWKLRAGVVGRKWGSAADARRQWRGHVVGQVQVLKREVDEGFDLLCEVALHGEAFEMDEEDGR